MTDARSSYQTYWGLFLLVLLCVPFPVFSSQPFIGSLFKNITNSEDVQEVHPAFTQDGASVVFMEFTGSPLGPGLPDYRLILVDRDGHSYRTIVSEGVIDYRLGPDEAQLMYLKGSRTDGASESDLDFSSQEIVWDLWRLDLESGGNRLVELGGDRDLSAGYRALQVSAYDRRSGEIWIPSPSGRRTVITTLVPNKKEYASVNLFQIDGARDARLVLTSDAYQTHHHYSWLPEIVWLDEQTLVIVQYEGANGASDAAKWSLVEIDLADHGKKKLYSSNRIKAFPKMSLDISRTLLYFQQLPAAGTGTELWRLNLATGKADIVYHTDAELGKAWCSPIGSSLVMTQLLDGKFDIIRLDLELNKLERLAIN